MKKGRDNSTLKGLVLFTYDIITLMLSSLFALLIMGEEDLFASFQEYLPYSIVAIGSSVIIYFID
jgi:uncharacterized membrane protein required for colicin V production